MGGVPVGWFATDAKSEPYTFVNCTVEGHHSCGGSLGELEVSYYFYVGETESFPAARA